VGKDVGCAADDSVRIGCSSLIVDGIVVKEKIVSIMVPHFGPL
jgi:hypothetical protein